jgi:hypothetical protein
VWLVVTFKINLSMAVIQFRIETKGSTLYRQETILKVSHLDIGENGLMIMLGFSVAEYNLELVGLLWLSVGEKVAEIIYHKYVERERDNFLATLSNMLPGFMVNEVGHFLLLLISLANQFPPPRSALTFASSFSLQYRSSLASI